MKTKLLVAACASALNARPNINGMGKNANQGKGMIVSMSRRIAVDLYNEIVAIKPEWHSDDLNDSVIKVVMTASASDGDMIAKHHTTK